MDKALELTDYLLNFVMLVEDYDQSKHEKATTMLRQQQAEIEVLKAKLNKYHLKEDLDRNLNLIYGKEFIK